VSTQCQALLFDMVQCLGCRKCIQACNELHGFEGDAEKATELSATAYTVMTEVEGYAVRNLCRHCLSPTCVSVCPVGALIKHERGPVVWEADRCIGCRYCILACPFNIPRYEWDDPVPSVRKCDMCVARLEQGKPPACAEACPAGATLAGPRDELLKEAHRRIQESPDDYYDHVYGESEVGGTSVLFLAPFPVEALGYKEVLGDEPLPVLTSRVLNRIPDIVFLGGAALMAIWWITRRREEVARAEGPRTLRLLGKEESDGET
jgi:formate dehydrogenase iron-sulfur subunit